MSDVTLVNMNMLYVRYLDRVEREVHLPLGPLHVARSLEDHGFKVDFRDFQLCDHPDLFSESAIADFLDQSADVLFVSCMANLLPFTLSALRRFKEEHPWVTVVLGGVGPFSVEKSILKACPWIDVIGRGEGELSTPVLLRALKEQKQNKTNSKQHLSEDQLANNRLAKNQLAKNQLAKDSSSSFSKDQPDINEFDNELDLSRVPGIAWRHKGRPILNPPPERITRLDELPWPAYHLVDLRRYHGINMLSSRGCPFPCTFCSVAPIWGRVPHLRSPESIVEEMRYLHEKRGAELFLFQDEYFVSTKERVLEVCKAISTLDFKARWKAFGRIDLTDPELMEAMAEAGCVELRYGVESGSDLVLEKTKKGFTAAQAMDVLSIASGIFPGVDAFYMWGFPFETMDEFQKTLMHMLSARAMGVRILPSLVSYLPQTDLYNEIKDNVEFEFCPELFPEYMLTGHEICVGGRMEIIGEHRGIYKFIDAHREIFPGFFHVNVEGNVLPKYQLLQKFGFYTLEGRNELLGSDVECCGAHQPD